MDIAHVVDGRGGRSLRLGVGAVIAMLCCVWLISSHVSKAEATDIGFCQNAWLQPYGQGGDRCTAPQGGNIWLVYVITQARAGCETIQNNGVLLNNWTCGGAYSSVGSYQDWSKWSHGIIRNNNLSFGGYFSGQQSGNF